MNHSYSYHYVLLLLPLNIMHAFCPFPKYIWISAALDWEKIWQVTIENNLTKKWKKIKIIIWFLSDDFWKDEGIHFYGHLVRRLFLKSHLVIMIREWLGNFFFCFVLFFDEIQGSQALSLFFFLPNKRQRLHTWATISLLRKKNTIGSRKTCEND